MPWWGRLAAGSVRTSSAHQSVSVAQLVQIFCPVITSASPSMTPLVRSEARSEPASGSEKPWHQSSSPASSGGMYLSRCAWVPYLSIVGPTISSPMAPAGCGARARASSSLKASW